ncbi:MAG: Lrp/AsnC family transcriptional regulator [Caldisericia bacterium]|nr:Lrp/AsnC family transcriptional regulator [Caldisericia bacterium]MDD4615005.1 Lrp/AsnC family transcriptional regulator [Caldisericia bacterium]
MSSKYSLQNIDRSILEFLQLEIPVCERPYKELSQRLRMTENEIVQRIQFLIDQGFIKRLGAILYHHSVGYTYNALVAWAVSPSSSSLVAEVVKTNLSVSHCYFRSCPDAFPYPLFTMIHERTEQKLNNRIHELSKLFYCIDYIVLKSIKEWKKTSMQYTL